MSIEEVRLFLEKSQHLLVLCHSNADPDALASALSVKIAYPDKDVAICCDGLSKTSKHLLAYLGEDLGSLECDPDSILVVDTSSPELLGSCMGMLEKTDRLAMVDHHSSLAFSPSCSYRRTATSNAELMWEVLSRPGDVRIRKALLTGVLTDTGHLRFATRHTFGAISEMLGDDIVFEEIFMLLREDIDLSQKMALFKALQRMKIIKVGDFTIAKTSVGTFESLVGRTILSIGADVVLIINEKKGKRIVARASRRAVDKGVDLSVIMADAGRLYGGDGGGHPPAAGLINIEDFKKASNSILETITSIFQGN